MILNRPTGGTARVGGFGFGVGETIGEGEILGDAVKARETFVGAGIPGDAVKARAAEVDPAGAGMGVAASAEAVAGGGVLPGAPHPDINTQQVIREINVRAGMVFMVSMMDRGTDCARRGYLCMEPLQRHVGQ